MSKMIRKADAAVTKAEDVLDIADIGLGVAQTVFTIGSHVPIVGGIFAACKDVLADVKAVKGKADDVAEAGRRVVEVLKFTEALPSVLSEMREEQQSDIQAQLEPLKKLLGDFGACLKEFGKKGWYKKAWAMKSHVHTLAKLDKQIKRVLESVKEMYSLARDKNMMQLLLEQRTYPLEHEIRKRVREKEEETGDEEEDVRAALAADPEVVTATAADAGVPEDVFRAEIGEFRAEMGTRFSELTKLLDGYGAMLKGMDKKLDEANMKIDALTGQVGELKMQNAEILGLLHKIDANSHTSADEKRSLKGLVGTLARQPTMVDVVTHVVGGDGAAAAAALAAKPADVRASAGARFAEGAALQAEGKYDEAVVAYRAAVEADPEMSGAWFSLGCAEFLKAGGKSSEVQIEPYERCVALDPTHATAHNNLGNALNNVRKDYDGAEELYRKAIALNPKYAAAHMNLGLLLETVRKDYDGAEELYRKAIALNPKHAEAHSNLALLLKNARKDYDGAEELYRKAIALDATHAEAHYNLGTLLQTVRKDYDGAEELFHKAIALNPTHASAHNNLGNLLKDIRKDYDGAEEHVRKAIALNPKYALAFWTLSEVFECRGDLDGAIREMREAVRCGGDGDGTKEHLAELIAKQK